MQNDGCGHVGHRVYVRRIFSNGTTHYGVQCKQCKRIIKTEQHGYRLWIKQSEIPSDQPIFPYMEG